MPDNVENVKGANHVVEFSIVHDNGQDPFQAKFGLSNFTVRNSWLYNGRPHRRQDLYRGMAFNWCRHSDGIQVYDGGDQHGLTFDTDIVGPGMLQGMYATEGCCWQPAPAGQGIWSTFHDVTVRNTIYFMSQSSNMSVSNPHTTPTNYNFDHVTAYRVYCPPNSPPTTCGGWEQYLWCKDAVKTPNSGYAGENCNQLPLNSNFGIGSIGSNIRLTNSIIVGGGGSNYPSGTTFSNDYSFATTNLIGTVADPQFKSIPMSQPLNGPAFDFTPQNTAVRNSGAGASIHTVADLLATGNGGSLPSSPAPSASPAPSSDINSDSKINVFDAAFVLLDWGKTGVPGFSPAYPDRNCVVNALDLKIVLTNFGR